MKTQMKKKKKQSKHTETYWKMRSHEKLHNIIVLIHDSETCMRDFKCLTERTISCDNSTRWNSWYLMIKIVIDKTAAIDSYTKQWYETFQNNFLSLQDCKILSTISSFLQSFCQTILKTEKDCATIDHVLFIMNILIKHFNKFLISCIIFKLLFKLDLI